ncbi:platelet glycoprotein IX [Protopterus annectens]|uniref:platelet glycoprotein IX n=1 Tax=Protopterus annectens TaxID=7888 RepID=UPI001CFB7693|nr:platelet glycoprotein IX [Protopterus annectens]XP_043934023.1 platelet glycoprotein IX [Protopterus annectens]XP_043934024.1 platelet glycoprotein IX [Protopterus annectens]
MFACPGLAVLLFLRSSSAESCPFPCTCTTMGLTDLKVVCSFGSLEEIPALPKNTTELYLEGNLLTRVLPGTFDSFTNLRKVNLSNNPWNCDCNIIYLKMWLQDQPLHNHNDVICSTPSELTRVPVTKLTYNDFVTCSHHRNHCSDFMQNIVILFIMLLLLVLTVCSLMLAKRRTFKLDITDYQGEIELHSLQPTKSHHNKRREKRHNMNKTTEAKTSFESPNLEIEWTNENLNDMPFCQDNTELLPQIIHILDTKYDIKLKEN